MFAFASRYAGANHLGETSRITSNNQRCRILSLMLTCNSLTLKDIALVHRYESLGPGFSGGGRRLEFGPGLGALVSRTFACGKYQRREETWVAHRTIGWATVNHSPSSRNSAKRRWRSASKGTRRSDRHPGWSGRRMARGSAGCPVCADKRANRCSGLRVTPILIRGPNVAT